MTVSKESHHFIDSDYSVHFRDALSSTGISSSFANIRLDSAVLTGALRMFINSIRILSINPCDWRVELYSKSPYGKQTVTTGDPTTAFSATATKSDLIGWTQFASATSYFAAVGVATGSASVSGISQPLGSATMIERVATQYGTLFMYFAQGLRIPYVDLDTARGGGELHVNLVCVGPGQMTPPQKSAGDGGLVSIRFGVIAAS